MKVYADENLELACLYQHYPNETPNRNNQRTDIPNILHFLQHEIHQLWVFNSAHKDRLKNEIMNLKNELLSNYVPLNLIQ